MKIIGEEIFQPILDSFDFVSSEGLCEKNSRKKEREGAIYQINSTGTTFTATRGNCRVELKITNGIRHVQESVKVI